VADLVLLWLAVADDAPLPGRAAAANDLNRFLGGWHGGDRPYRECLLDVWLDWVAGGLPARGETVSFRGAWEVIREMEGCHASQPVAPPGAAALPTVKVAASELPPGVGSPAWVAEMKGIENSLAGWGGMLAAGADLVPASRAAGTAGVPLQQCVAAFSATELDPDRWGPREDQPPVAQAAGPGRTSALAVLSATPGARQPETRAAQMDLEDRALAETLARFRTPSAGGRRPVVLIGFQTTSRRVVAYAVKLDKHDRLRVCFAPTGGAAVTPRGLRASVEAFQGDLEQAWARLSGAAAAPDPLKEFNWRLATGLSEALRRFLTRTDEQFGKAVSLLLDGCADEPDVLVSAGPPAQSLLLDLLTIDGGRGRGPLIQRAHSVRWLPGLGLQGRLDRAAAALRGEPGGEKVLGACGYLPHLEPDRDGGYYREAEEGARSRGPDYLCYRCLARAHAGPVVLGRDVQARAVRQLAQGGCQDLLIHAHGCESGAAVLWDALLDNLGPCPRLESLLLVSCDIGRLRGQGPDGPPVSHSLMARLLSGGQGGVAHVAAFRYCIPDLAAVHFALELLDAFRGDGLPDMAGARGRLLARAFCEPGPAAEACTALRHLLDSAYAGESPNGNDHLMALAATAFCRFVAAVSVAYSGRP
jgi:hypothetical protein